jgi:hypothetical protein
VCNTTTHQCECASDDDCDGLLDGDICVNGRCGCSDATHCNLPNPHLYAEAVCQ